MPAEIRARARPGSSSTPSADALAPFRRLLADKVAVTFDAAYEFFQANPDFTVAHLNAVLDKCLPLPKEPAHTQEGNDPLWHARKGKDISFLIQHLDKIAASLNCVDEVAPFQMVPAEQLFRKRLKSSRKAGKE